MALKLILLFILISNVSSFSFWAPKNPSTECTEENYQKLGIDFQKVSKCEDVDIKVTDLGSNKFWIIIKYFYNIHYYDLEFNLSEEATESIIAKGFDVRHLVRSNKKILFLTNNNCEDYSRFKHLHSIHDFETKTSLLVTKNFTTNGIIFNKYHIRNVDNGKHIVVEFKDTVDTFEDIYYNNLLSSKTLTTSNKNSLTINLNINVDYMKNNKNLKTEIKIMNILIYWNAVAMLFSGFNNKKFSIKVQNINFSENPGVLFSKDYTMFGIHKSMKNYFIENKISDREKIDIQISMTTSEICLRSFSHVCDIEAYTLLLSDEFYREKYNIAVISYSSSLFNYNLGAREVAHLSGVSYDVNCDGIMNRKSKKFNWCKISGGEEIENSINTQRRNSRSHGNSHLPFIE